MKIMKKIMAAKISEKKPAAKNEENQAINGGVIIMKSGVRENKA